MSSATPSTSSQPSSILQFNNIYEGGRSISQPGILKLAPSSMLWSSRSTSKNFTISKQDITAMDWVKSTKGCQLRNKLKTGTCIELVGFKDSDYETINNFVTQNFGIDITKKDISTKGSNYGQIELVGNMLIFNDTENRQSFEVSLANVSQSAVQQNTELTLEFHQDDTASKEDESLVEMRFYVPPNANDPNSNNNEEEEPVANEKSFAHVLHQQILEKGEIMSDEDAIVTFNEIAFLTPRGRYNIEMFPRYMKLRGKTYDFKILYSSISNMFLLPKPGDGFMFFVISLSSPIRHGQTPHYHLVLNFAKNMVYEEDAPLKLNLTKKEIEENYPNITQSMNGVMFEVVAKIFKSLVQDEKKNKAKIIGPGSFTSSDGYKGVRCSFGSNDGYLFLLEKSIFFLHKPPMYVKHDEIKSVKFQRTDNRAGASKNFDISFNLKKGKTMNFSNLPKREYDKLLDFLTSKQLKIENIQEGTDKTNVNLILPDDSEEEEDEDFNPNAEDSADEEFDENEMAKDDFAEETKKKKPIKKDSAESDSPPPAKKKSSEEKPKKEADSSPPPAKKKSSEEKPKKKATDEKKRKKDEPESSPVAATSTASSRRASKRSRGEEAETLLELPEDFDEQFLNAEDEEAEGDD